MKARGRLGPVSRLAILAVIAASHSCSYTPPTAELCSRLEGLPLTPLTEESRSTVFETPGVIIAVHGFGSATFDRGDYVKVEESIDLPAYVTRATVFLNGWRVMYAGDDHHVAEIGTAIGKIRLVRNRLTWNAVGMLRDDGEEESYEWTYRYTVVGWSEIEIDAVVNQGDAERFCNSDTSASDNFFVADNAAATTALGSFTTFSRNPDFPERGTIAVLPRGFGIGWNDDDHHMLQAAYNLDHSESFLEAGRAYRKGVLSENPLTGPASRVDGRLVSWSTYSILKDNDLRRGFTFGELSSVLAGSDIGLIQPPYEVLPLEDAGFGTGCISGSQDDVRTEEFTVENVPFQHAIPVLSGWDLAYTCDNEHVKEIGAWIEDWSYVPGNPGGVLRYRLSSSLRDGNNEPEHNRTHKVSIVGFKPVDVVTPTKRFPDLIPSSPLGTQLEHFCRMEENRKLLRVTVKNQGPGDAGTSETSVNFAGVTVTVRTPPLASGASVDLLFKVPNDCFKPDCGFRITVDAERQVDEGDKEGNNTAPGHCVG